MSATPKQAKGQFTQRLCKIFYRLGVLVAAGLIIGSVLNYAAASLEVRDKPAGFIHGVVQGALMPIALPNLAVGKDVPIYATRNTGRTYKLGYTIGVNACGLVFFGFFFWRVRRLRSANP